MEEEFKLERRISELKGQLSEAARQEEEANKLKLARALHFPVTSVLTPDPLHTQIMAQINQNKLSIMSQLNAAQSQLNHLRSANHMTNIRPPGQTYMNNPNSHRPMSNNLPLDHNRLPPNRLFPNQMAHQNLQQNLRNFSPNMASQHARPQLMNHPDRFGRPLMPPNSNNFQSHQSRTPLVHTQWHNQSLPNNNADRLARNETGDFNRYNPSDRNIQSNAVDDSSNGLHGVQLQRGNAQADPGVDVDVRRVAELGDDELPYVVNNQSMFNKERFESEPEFKEWCVKYNIVSIKRKDTSFANQFRMDSPGTVPNRAPFSSDRFHSSRSHPNSQTMNSNPRFQSQFHRSIDHQLSQSDRQQFEREFFDVNHGPSPGHPYYHTWYNKFIRRVGIQSGAGEPLEGGVTLPHRRVGDSRFPTHRLSDEIHQHKVGNSDRFHYRVVTPPPVAAQSTEDRSRLHPSHPHLDPPPLMDIDERPATMSLSSTPEPPMPAPMPLPPPPPEDHAPAPPMVPPPEMPEKPPDVYQLDQMLSVPGRREQQRLRNSLIIMRGPPGSGKSHIAKIIKDKEVAAGMTAPRILSIDDYFMVSDESGGSGKKGGSSLVYEYEEEMEDVYLSALAKALGKVVAEATDRLVIVDACNHLLRHIQLFVDVAQKNLMKVFLVELQPPVEVCVQQNTHKRPESDIRKVLESWEEAPNIYPRLDPAHFLSSVNMSGPAQNNNNKQITDSDRKDSSKSQSKTSGESEAKREHGSRKRQRSDSLELSDAEDAVETISANSAKLTGKTASNAQYYEPTEPTVSPTHWGHSLPSERENLASASHQKYKSKSASSNRGASTADESNSDSESIPDTLPSSFSSPVKSKWEIENSEDALDRMDGVFGATKTASNTSRGPRESIEDFLSSCGDSYFQRKTAAVKQGKKRVRWADVEERRELEQERRLGFIVGQTNWHRLMQQEHEVTSSALTKTKFI